MTEGTGASSPAPGGRPAADGWTIVERSRDVSAGGPSSLPGLIVLAAAPGWGRTTWMRGLRAQLDAAAAVATTWVASRAGVSELGSKPSGGVRTTVFVDDVLHSRDDPLWLEIAEAVASDPLLTVVAATLDTPRTDLAERISPRALVVLDEHDLALTPEEIAEVVEANGIVLAPDARDDLTRRLRGCPLLVRRQLERLRSRRSAGVWASMDFTASRALVDHAMAVLSAPADPPSRFAAFAGRSAAMRRFSKGLIGRDDDDDPVAAALDFERLRASPLGSFDVDDETGEDDFVWSDAAWQRLRDIAQPDADRRALRSAARTAAEQGRIVIQLFYMLSLGDLDAADALVFDRFRRFLLFTDGPTQTALLAVPPDELAGRPSLQLLAAELRLRVSGAGPAPLRGRARPSHGAHGMRASSRRSASRRVGRWPRR